ncbi:MAG: NAD(P)-binding domain-containing protein [Bacteroidetes bacterium]|nr:NAD(P)-binding domain-containing protein [Bacteroidota bacterium]
MIHSLDELKTKQSAPENKFIPQIAVIGGGIMGQGIAQTASSNGIEVILVEKNEKLAEIALKHLDSSMNQEIERWSLTIGEKKSIMSRIKTTGKIEDAAHCPIIIEAINEDFGLKKRLFHLLDQACDPSTVIVSNTSTLNLTKLADETNRPDRVIGMHFLNPVPKIPLVELIRAMKTSDETFTMVKEFAETQLGKKVVEVFEYPGFVTTRVIIPMINEAMQVFSEGIATAEGIDTAMKLGYGFQTGPLALADMMGLDDVLMWMEQLWQQLGEPKFRPAPVLRRMVREGKLGKKSGEGFFKYDEDR